MFVSKRKSLFWVFQFWLVLFTFSGPLGYFSGATPVQAATLNSLPASGPNLSVSPSSVTFTARKYDCTATPGSITVQLTTTSATTVNWSLDGNVTYDNSGFANWLSFDNTTGTVSSTTPTGISFHVLCTLFSPVAPVGNYTATVKVVDTSDATNFATFTVNYSVTERGVRATRVYGQPDFSSHDTTGQATATDLNRPQGVTVDSYGNVYIADTQLNRVLFYPSGSTTPTKVYGQPDFTSHVVNYGGSKHNNSDIENNIPVATSLRYPNHVLIDPLTGGLYIGDGGNGRVLYFPPDTSNPNGPVLTTPTRVYGKPNYNYYIYSGDPISASNIAAASGLAIDLRTDGLYLTDGNANRVLYYPSQSTTPTQVYGQPDYTSHGSGTSATAFYLPAGLVVDTSGGLYVADTLNRRVLYFPPDTTNSTGPALTTANVVYGQQGCFTCSNSVTGANATAHPSDVELDSVGNLLVADGSYTNGGNGYYRVEVFPKGSTSANRVYGQVDLAGGGTYSGNSNTGTVNEYGFSSVGDVVLDSRGGLYVTDIENSRVLYFDTNVASVNLTSSANPANLGQAVTFTATVTPSVASNGYPTHPTGQVIFKDGATMLGSVTLPTSGSGASTATFNVTNFTSGTHPIVAVYSGDTFFAAASSNLVNQVVTTTPAPLFSLNKTQVDFTNVSGGSSSSTVSLSLSSGTTTWTSSIQYTGTPPFNWLSLTPTSGTVSSTSPATITFTANSSRVFPRPTIYLAAGVYYAVVTFTDTNNSNNKVSVNVSYQVCSATQC